MSSSGNPSSSGGGGGPCGACKFLRRKCVAGCIFAPYFDFEQGAAHFAAVHKVFGASNVSKLLLHIPEHKRPDAVVSICFEAQARLRDPIYGCVSHIVSLQQQVVSLQTELSYLQAHLATLELPQPMAPVSSSGSLQALSITDLPTISPSLYDLSSFFEPVMSSTWAMQQQPRPSDHVFGVPSSSSIIGGGGEIQALAPEFIHGGQMPAQPSLGTSGSASTVIKRE
ncbi:PREDICTED: LOB domain-containing protein 30-like [Camelina sativa]|uniref:LOB domain-containing protein 30-like n=1 Tax=Camelina sativa TaxID=90675 RepID=A0ABM0VHQ5_CAMSA|nr:PREDICTED: LOB domain-containing protein 30-like [Camelina sativa]